MTTLTSLLTIALCCGAMAFTITTTSIFSGFREWVSSFHPKLEELVFCPWCFNHYVVAVFLLTSGTLPVEVSEWVVYDFFVNLFAIVGLSGVLHHILLRAYEPVKKEMMSRHMEKLQKQRRHDN